MSQPTTVQLNDQVPSSSSKDSTDIDLTKDLSGEFPAKKSKFKDSKNSYYVIPFTEIQETNKFIIGYVAKHKSNNPAWQFAPLRWTNKNNMELQQTMNLFGSKIKHTATVLAKKINVYLKTTHLNQIAEETSHIDVTDVTDVTAVTSTISIPETISEPSLQFSTPQKCRTCGREYGQGEAYNVAYCSASCYDERV
jgi:hypothetical protein